MADREAEYARIRAILDDLEASGLTVYKIALLLGQFYNTVKHWKSTGRVESHDAQALIALHRQYCGAAVCQLNPQYCKTFTTSS
jgi:hypothetical protein